jgi:hypothetical protein
MLHVANAPKCTTFEHTMVCIDDKHPKWSHCPAATYEVVAGPTDDAHNVMSSPRAYQVPYTAL